MTQKLRENPLAFLDIPFLLFVVGIVVVYQKPPKDLPMTGISIRETLIHVVIILERNFDSE